MGSTMTGEASMLPTTEGSPSSNKASEGSSSKAKDEQINKKKTEKICLSISVVGFELNFERKVNQLKSSLTIFLSGQHAAVRGVVNIERLFKRSTMVLLTDRLPCGLYNLKKPLNNFVTKKRKVSF